jgi:hypothetical protein
LPGGTENFPLQTMRATLLKESHEAHRAKLNCCSHRI